MFVVVEGKSVQVKATLNFQWFKAFWQSVYGVGQGPSVLPPIGSAIDSQSKCTLKSTYTDY